jgi:hypothetical protein
MFLKNYTSEVPVAQTVHRIEQVLIRCGVTGITKEYGPGASIVAVMFHIKFGDQQPFTVRLPADKEKALQAMWLDYADGDRLSEDGSRMAWNARKKKCRRDFVEQAERTAWKLVQDWVEVQLSMIQMGQAEFTQVFLPYIWDGRQIFYDTVKADGFRALPAPRAIGLLPAVANIQ